MAPPPPRQREQSRLPPFEQLYVFAGLACGLLLLLLLQTPAPKGEARWLPVGRDKRAYEQWVLRYSLVWTGAFAVIIALELYEGFGALAYFLVCGGLAAPLLLREVLLPPYKPWAERHGVRAQAWLLVFGFLGNYWCTHYFYCVLKASYTLPAWRLNDVPICMYQATHFYFSSYHVLGNLLLRRTLTSFAPGRARAVLLGYVVCALSYTTAFLETLTISHFPYYDFEDREMVYTVGSAFYGIYFLVSFPVYFSIDEPGFKPPDGLRGVIFSALASGMLVLLLLDLARLALAGEPLTIGGKLWEVTPKGSTR